MPAFRGRPIPGCDESRADRGGIALERAEISPDGGNDRRSVLDGVSGCQNNPLYQSSLREDLGTTLRRALRQSRSLAGGGPSRGYREGEKRPRWFFSGPTL